MSADNQEKDEELENVVAEGALELRDEKAPESLQ
jgi:hypothetical protein